MRGGNELTPREKIVADGIARGLSNKAIAFETGMTEFTVKVHCKAIGRKTGVRGRGAVAVKLVIGKVIEIIDDVDAWNDLERLRQMISDLAPKVTR